MKTDDNTCVVCGVGGMDTKLSKEKMCTSCEQKVNDTVHLLNTNVSSSNNADDVVSCLDRLKLYEDISDNKLFADPPKRECPICMLPMPFTSQSSIDMFCCGKSICVGCVVKAKDEISKGNMKDWCPLCRVPTISSNDMSFLKKRTEANDPEALYRLGISYSNGQDGLLQDHKKSFELFYRGAEFGSIRAHYNLACAYLVGEGVENDMKKAMYHFKFAAIGGHEGARYSLGIFDKSDINRSMKHYMVAARSGYDTALKKVGEGYKVGHVTKDDYAKTLRAYQFSVDQMKSQERTEAVVVRGGHINTVWMK